MSLLRFCHDAPERAEHLRRQATGKAEASNFDAARRKVERLRTSIEENGGLKLCSPLEALQDQTDRINKERDEQAQRLARDKYNIVNRWIKMEWKSCDATFRNRNPLLGVEVQFYRRG